MANRNKKKIVVRIENLAERAESANTRLNNCKKRAEYLSSCFDKDLFEFNLTGIEVAFDELEDRIFAFENGLTRSGV